MPAVYNASNEVAVEAFLNSQIKFTAILQIVSAVVDSQRAGATTKVRDLSDVSAIENNARAIAKQKIAELVK